MQLMDNAPHQFCLQHSETTQKLLFKTSIHIYRSFFNVFNMHYHQTRVAQKRFTQWMNKKDETMENALNGFYHYFFSLPDIPQPDPKRVHRRKRTPPAKGRHVSALDGS